MIFLLLCLPNTGRLLAKNQPYHNCPSERVEGSSFWLPETSETRCASRPNRTTWRPRRGCGFAGDVPIRLLGSRGHMARSPDPHGAGERRPIVFSDLSVEPGNAWICPGQGRNTQEPPACIRFMKVYRVYAEFIMNFMKLYPCLSQGLSQGLS